MSAAQGGTAARWLRLATQLPRDKADTLLLLLSSVFVLAPHAHHLPLWASLTCSATLLWRVQITFRGTRLPSPWLLLPIAMLAMIGVFLTFHTMLGRDSGVAMLVLLLAFKLMEMRAKRDLFVVVFLSFFVLLTNFFYSQSIGTAALMIATLILVLTAQLSFQYTGAVPSLLARLRLAATIFGIAAPLALTLFVVFPRVQGPLWGMPGDARGGRTGLSDSMSPGNLSNLAQSEEVAFRVKFVGSVPPQAHLYWRGIVMSNYDGRTWTPFSPGQSGNHPVALVLRGTPVRYQVTLEPSNARWLFALDVAQQAPRVDGYSTAMSGELEMATNTPLATRVRYDVASYLDHSIQADATPAQMRPWLALPRGFNPRTLALAQTLRNPQDPQAGARAVLRMFGQEKFVYTLEPPLLGPDAVDDFLFSTKAGFCEHYASAFVVLMRAMGIPARVVTGYQGGETNPVDGYLTVRQSDAHAWAEIWLAGRGWIRVDPTAAVAPDRVEKNLAHALPRTPPFGIDSLGGLVNFQLDRNSWLASLRFKLSAINNSWNQWVLDYNPVRQQNLLDALEDRLASWRTLLVLALAGALALALRWRQLRRHIDPVDALYLALCQQLARRGFVRALDEGPQGYGARLAGMQATPRQKSAIVEFLRLYGAHRYGIHPDGAGSAHTDALVRTLKSLLSQIQ